MKINQNNANINQNPVLLNTLVKQVSELQIDTQQLETNLNNLDSAVNSHITFNRDGDGRTEVNNLASNDISVSKAAIQEANISHLTSANSSITNLTSNSGVIKNLQSTHIDADDANITHLDVESQAHLQDTDVAKSLTVHGLTTTEDIHAKNIESISLHTTDVETTALNAVSGNISTVNSNNINASNKITTEDLEVKGEITGVSDMEMHDLVANDIKANSADIDKIIWIEQILDKTHVIDPSPELSNVDRYTIQLPKFSGWYIITCLGPNNTIKWAATVRGNGYDYSISWYADSTTECITNLFQYQGQLYIRHSANGVIAFAYSADRDLPDPTIYFNTDTPTISDLATVTDEKYQYEVYTLSGTIFFGLFVAPRLESITGDEGTINFKGNITIAELHDKLAEASKGDVWNITDYGYTSSDFIEGEGHPINIDDDVVAVEVEEENIERVELDTFFNDYIKKFLFRDNSGDIICYTTENIYLGNNYSTTIKAYKKISDNNWEELGTILDNVTLPNPIEIVSVKQIENGKIFIFPDKYYKVENDTKTGFFYYTTEDNVTFTENVLNFYYFGLNDWVISPDAYNAVSGNSIGVVAFNTSVSDLYHCSLYSFDGGQTWNHTTKVDWAEVISIVSLPNDHLGLVTQNEILEKGENFESVFHKFSSDRYLSMTSLLFKASDSEFIVCDNYEYSQHDGPGIYKIDISGEYITFNKISDDLFTSALRNAYISYSQNSINGSVVLDGLKAFNTRGPFNLTDLPSDIENVKQVLYVTDTNYNLIITDSNNQIYTYYYVPGKTKYIKWDKFAAGVNYEDFRAKKITAEEELISEGTLEVDRDSTFKGNIELDNTTSEISATGNLELSVTDTTTETYTGAKTVTLTAGETINGNITQHGNKTLDGDLTQTGNQNVTGNETIIGTVVIGELE